MKAAQIRYSNDFHPVAANITLEVGSWQVGSYGFVPGGGAVRNANRFRHCA